MHVFYMQSVSENYGCSCDHAASFSNCFMLVTVQIQYTLNFIKELEVCFGTDLKTMFHISRVPNPNVMMLE